MRRRILSILTALALCLSLCPTWAFAAEGGSEPADLVLNVGELTGVQKIEVDGNTVSMDGGEAQTFSTLVLTGTAENLWIRITSSGQVTLRDLNINIVSSDIYTPLLELNNGSSVCVEGTVTLESSGPVIVVDNNSVLTGPGSLKITYSGTDTAVLLAQGISIGGDLSISAPNGCPAEAVSGYVCPITAQNITLTHDQDRSNTLNLNAMDMLTINDQVIVAKVTPVDDTRPQFAYLTEAELDSAFAEASSYANATFTLLADVERERALAIRINCILDLGGHTICCKKEECLVVHFGNTTTPFNVTIRGEGQVISTNNTALTVWGNVKLEGGTFSGNGEDYCGVYVTNEGAKLSIRGEKVIIRNTGGGYGLAIASANSIKLRAGTYSGEKGAIKIFNSITLGDLLEVLDGIRCVYFDENGAPIIGKLGDHALTGTVTVKECNHTGDGVCEYTPNEGAETHAMICLACGRAETEEACTYSGEYEHDETNHWQTCTLCGRKKTEAHRYGSWEPEYNENAVTIRRSCENCGYTKTDGTFTVPAPGQTMQYGKPITLTCSSTLPGATFSWSLNENPADVTGDRFTPPGTLAVGIYRCDVTVKWPGSESNICTKPVNFGVTPAPLTATAATAESRPYNGSNLVEITSVTLDGILNDDDVSVATTGLSGTLSGSNAGSYTNLTLPAMTLTGAGAGNYTVLQPAGAVPASVTIEKAPALTLTPNPGDLAVTNRQEHTYTYGLGALRPDVQEGMSLGSTAVTYELGTVSLGSYYTGGAKIEGQTLTLPIEAVESNSETGIGTITVTIHTGNYEDMTATINVRSVNKTVPTGEPTLSTDTLNYGQTLSAITLSGSMQDNGTSVPGTFAWSSPDNRPAVQEKYAAAWTFTPTDNGKYAIVTGTALIRVLPAPIAGAVIVLDHTAFKYDGQPHGPGIASVTLDGTALTADVDYTAEIPEGIEAGTYTVTLTGKGSYTGTATAVFRINPVETVDIPQEDDTGKKLKLEVETGISQIPAALQNNEELNSPAKIEEKMKTVLTAADTSIPEENTEVYDAALLVSTDGGTSWEKATADNFPSGGLTITLPYPEGTGRDTHDFVVTHMFTTSDFGRMPGETEQPEITKTAEGIRFTVTGLSPIAVAWKDITVEPTPTPTPPSGGGSYWTGGGSGPVTTYAVTVEKVEHGAVTASRVNAASGSTVTLTVTPDAGYVLDTLTVTDSRGSEVKLTGKGNGKYTFTMPGRAVTVKATFAPLPEDAEQGDRLQPCDGGADCPSRGFADLGSVGTWYHEAVDYALRSGLMGGYSNGLFGPDDTLTRAQFAQILYNKEGRPTVTGGSVFPDVAEGAWCAPAISWAAEQGIVGGYGNGLFGPDDNITREHLAVMLWRYAGSPAATDKELHFTDADRASGYALEALRWALENGIMSGKGGGVLDPKGRATRAQTAQMVENFVTH